MGARSPLFLLLVLLFLAILQTVFYYPQLPNIIASHFAANGEANGWSSKQAFFLIYFAVLSLLLGVFLFLPLVLPRLPVSLINLPNRTYWLAAERKEQTLQFVRDRMWRAGAATMSFLIATFQLVIQANLRPEKRLSSTMWVLVGVYVLFIGRWVQGFHKRFR